jgi:peptidoglycan/LPS O-acetylase OafA/YrhL
VSGAVPSAIESGRQVFGTFGLYRFILAASVVMSHAGPTQWYYVAQYAVFAFYVLSGYVVAYILHYNYLPIEGGLRKYAINRALRIYPLYWLVFLVSYEVNTLFPQEAMAVQWVSGVPSTVTGWIFNITSVGLAEPLSGLIPPNVVVPVGWTLGVEITYWALMPKFLSSQRVRRWWLGFALLYTGLVIAIMLYRPATGFEAQPIRYSSTLAASLPFCIGLYLFLARKNGRIIIPHAVGSVNILIWCLLLAGSPYIFGDPFLSGFYVALAVNAVMVGYLSRIAQESLPRWLRRCDRFFGDLAYPIYLVHVPIAAILLATAPDLHRHSWPLLLATLMLSILSAAALHYSIEVPVSRWKRFIKQRG